MGYYGYSSKGEDSGLGGGGGVGAGRLVIYCRIGSRSK